MALLISALAVLAYHDTTMERFDDIERKMRLAGADDVAVATFRHHFERFLTDSHGYLHEADIEPARDLEVFSDDDELAVDSDLLDHTVVIKLNGGLGTGMGLRKAKSLLKLRGEETFLDLIIHQIESLRERSDAHVHLLLMNSFATSADTRAFMAAHATGDLADPEQFELMQNQVPKLDAATLLPAEWPADPDLEWCPPGHGDVYPALAGSGWLDRLLEKGIRYAFVSNSDNLGAVLDPALLQRFADGGASFLIEVTRRTPADRKGGHLAVRRADGHLLLRELAQCDTDDVAAFQDIDRHRYFNTNNIWLRLDALKDLLDANGGVLPLPVIRNSKSIDPRDKDSLPVIQLESAMGAAIRCFDGAAAVEVPRTRFAPVKTTGDLLALRSDAYEIKSDGGVRLVPERRGVPPVVTLGDDYKLVDSLDGLGVPSLVGAGSLELVGTFAFADGVVVEGDVKLVNRGETPAIVPAGLYRDEHREFQGG